MKLQRRPDACWGKLSQPQNDAGEESNVVLWSPVERRLHILNATAAAVWGQLKTPTTIDDLIDAITARFRARRPIVARDVKVLLERLQTAELVCSSDVAAQFPPVAPIADYERPADRYPNHVGPTTIGPLCVLGCPMLPGQQEQGPTTHLVCHI